MLKDPTNLKYPILIASKYALESALFFFDRNNLWRFATDTSALILLICDGVNRGNPYASGYAYWMMNVNQKHCILHQ
jgi:hypothetical protein